LSARFATFSGTPGASVGILHEGQVIFTENFGYRDVATRVVPTADTVYGLGSLTKSFVAAAIAKLFDDQEHINLTTPVTDIIPDFKPKDPSLKRLLSTGDLLSHGSGLLGDMSVAVQVI
jgi:CubicO group peptidase (beta-lactamase class C family)